ncbi:MAG: response regulator [Deltaproteobacteria bacterium]|nr:response regulator [Deltaproteobacteria bacterium]
MGKNDEKRFSVLFVDDEAEILNGFRDALRKQPFSILTATSGDQGLAMLEEHRIDVVVSDEQMPKMSGTEFLGVVRQRHPNTVRIVLTGQASLDAAIRAINEGEVYRFLTKPCSPIDLAFTIMQGLQMRELAYHSARLLDRSRKQRSALEALEAKHPGISQVEVDDRGAILLDQEDIAGLIAELEREGR